MTAAPVLPALEGRRILLTGASHGIGSVAAAELARQGASLALVARNPGGLEDVVAKLAGGPHDVFAFDARDEVAWLSAAERIAPQGLLHGIVTAAAALTPIGSLGTWSVADFRATLDLNVTGTLLAVTTNLDALKAARGSVVTFSGGGATAPFVRFDAYAASKAAVVRLTENLAMGLRDDGVRANSVAPGFVVTPMHNETIAAGPETVGRDYYERTKRAIEEGGGDPPELAAELAAFLLSDASSGITGKLLSARWDPWRDGAFQERLRTEVDLATLRRIDDQFFTTTSRV
ncbi:MAG: family NAD(P)-dependent oxidoreductase [Acidimicrobiaceae bacterium]|nr:family NAD(P)-dependent oxidoreductase [Acidimicrobiaceae bacterium]